MGPVSNSSPPIFTGHTPLDVAKRLRSEFPGSDVRVEGESVVLMTTEDSLRVHFSGGKLVLETKPEVDEARQKYNPNLKNNQGDDIVTMLLKLIRDLNNERSKLQMSMGMSKSLLIKGEYQTTLSQADKQFTSAVIGGIVGVGLGLTSAGVQLRGLQKMTGLSKEVDKLGQQKMDLMQGKTPGSTPSTGTRDETPGETSKSTWGKMRDWFRSSSKPKEDDRMMEMQDITSRHPSTESLTSRTSSLPEGTEGSLPSRTDGTPRPPPPEGGSGGSRTEGETGHTQVEGGTGTPPPEENPGTKMAMMEELSTQRDSKLREYFKVEQSQRALASVLDSGQKGADAFAGMVNSEATREGAMVKLYGSNQAMLDTAMQAVLQQTGEAHSSLQQAALTYLQAVAQMANSSRTI